MPRERLGRGRTSGVWQTIRADFLAFERRRIAARSDWQAIADQLAAEGVEDGAGRAPSAAIVKRTFFRARLAVRQDRAALVALDVAAAEAAAADARRVAEARSATLDRDVREGVARLLARACEGSEAERLAVLAAAPHLLPVLGLSAPVLPPAPAPEAPSQVTLATPEATPQVTPFAAPGASPARAAKPPAARRDPLAPPKVGPKYADDDRSDEAECWRRIKAQEKKENDRRMKILFGDDWEDAPAAKPAPAPAAVAPCTVEAAAKAPAPVVDKPQHEMTSDELKAAIKASQDAEYERGLRIMEAAAARKAKRAAEAAAGASV